MSNKPVVLFCFSPLPFFPLGLFIIVGNASKKASVRCCDNLKGTNTEGEQEKKRKKKKIREIYAAASCMVCVTLYQPGIVCCSVLTPWMTSQQVIVEEIGQYVQIERLPIIWLLYSTYIHCLAFVQ